MIIADLFAKAKRSVFYCEKDCGKYFLCDIKNSSGYIIVWLKLLCVGYMQRNIRGF